MNHNHSQNHNKNQNKNKNNDNNNNHNKRTGDSRLATNQQQRLRSLTPEKLTFPSGIPPTGSPCSTSSVSSGGGSESRTKS